MRTKKLISILLVVFLFFSFVACEKPEPDSTTAPSSVSTEPVATVTEPYTTEATEVATDGSLHTPIGVVLSQETLDRLQFIPWANSGNQPCHSYLYVGTDTVVVFPGDGITLTIPESWVGKVTVSWYRVNENEPWKAWINSTAMLEGWAGNASTLDSGYDENKALDVRDPNVSDYAYYNYLCAIYGIPKSYYDEVTATSASSADLMVDSHAALFIGEDEEYYYSVNLPEMWTTGNQYYANRSNMIWWLGEELYQSLMGDIVITEELALEMITVIQPLEKQTP